MAAIEVIVEIYSGAPNPRLALGDDELEELRRRIDELRRVAPRGRPQTPHLGYRGFVIFNPRREAGLPFRVDVHNGTVAVTDDAPAGKSARRDPEVFEDATGLEHWLLARAADQGYANDIARMGGPPARAAP